MPEDGRGSKGPPRLHGAAEPVHLHHQFSSIPIVMWVKAAGCDGRHTGRASCWAGREWNIASPKRTLIAPSSTEFRSEIEIRPDQRCGASGLQ
jgi:hypothetical protein